MTHSKPDSDLSFSLISGSYMADANGLAMINDNGKLNSLLPAFNDYADFIRERASRVNARKLIKKLSNGDNVITSNTSDPVLRETLYYAHVAACCELFEGWTIPSSMLKPSEIRQYIELTLAPYENEHSRARQSLANRIQNSDAVRTIQILRLLGLVTSPSNNMHQLSFAAGLGTRDIEGLHMVPGIDIKNESGGLMEDRHSLCFNKAISQAGHITLIDNDPAFSQPYESINERYNGKILAYNEDANTAMANMQELIARKSLSPVNTVVGLRIDHLMIPDVSKFFRSLVPLLDEISGFIFTIGKGHTLDEFMGRKSVMNAIFDYLKSNGMSPVRVLLHGNGNLEEQRNSPHFGLSPFTTYDIIYCKLIRKKIR